MPCKICIVDDFPESRERIASIIKKNTNYDVYTAESGVDLLNLFKKLKNNMPDLILLDILMPKMDGFEVAKLLKQSEMGGSIPIIFVTALDDIENFKKAFEMGGVDYIAKPFRKWELLARINSQLSQKNMLDKVKKQKQYIKSKKDDLQRKNAILETSLEILNHDTRNLFTNMKSILNLLGESPEIFMLNDCVDELFELTMEAVGYMRFSKRIFSVFDIMNKIKITEERIYLAHHKRIILNFSSYHFLFIETSSLIKNAISNIVENALKYSPEEKPVEINVNYNDMKVIISIIDHGPGIPDNEKRKICKKDYRINGNSETSGLGKGLWIAKNIISKEDGILKIIDNPSGGSIFNIELPVCTVKDLKEGLNKLSNWFNMPLSKLKTMSDSIKAAIVLNENSEIHDLDSLIFVNLLDFIRKENQVKNTEEIYQKLKSLKNNNPDGKKVLIVDDSLYVQLYLATFFNEFGYNVIDYAINGKYAVDFFKKDNPDIITLDNIMPVMNGLETAKKINKLKNNVKFIFITALGHEKHFISNLSKILTKDQYKLLVKPFNKEDLQKILAEL